MSSSGAALLPASEMLTDDKLDLVHALPMGSATSAGIQPDGTILLHIIRPGIVAAKNGKFRYTVDVLSQFAGVFAGWKMFRDHLSQKQREELGGLPRKVEDIGGRVLESWWDETVPPDPLAGWGQGAVVGRVRARRVIKEIIEDVGPEVIECSISTRATGVTPMNVGGEMIYDVQGIESQGSLDWVSEGGAGGRVAPDLQASTWSDMDIKNMTNEQLVGFLQTNHPDVATAVIEHAKAMQPPAPVVTPEPVVQVPVTLSTPSQPTAADLVHAALSSDAVQSAIQAAVKAGVAAERDSILGEAEINFGRGLQVRDLRTLAHAAIQARQELPDVAKEQLLSRYSISGDGEPSDRLNHFDQLDASGNVVKTAAELVHAQVEKDVADTMAILNAVRPAATVSGQGSGSLEHAGISLTVSSSEVSDNYAESYLAGIGFADPGKILGLPTPTPQGA